MLKLEWLKYATFLAAFGLAGLPQPAWSTSVEVAEAPTNDLQLTIAAISSAQQSLFLNIYELSSPEIADAVLGRIEAGVRVQIIEEGQPVGGLSSATKGIVSQLVQAMQSARAEDRFFEMTSRAGGKRRFHYDHAKYAVIDESSLLIGSENYSPTGNPQAGTTGNRGWEVLIHDSTLALQFEQTFLADTQGSGVDILDLTQPGVMTALFSCNCVGGGKKVWPRPFPWNPPRPVTPSSPVTTLPPVQRPDPTTGVSGLPVLMASQVQKITSPDTSLSGLTNMLRSAQKTIDVQQMTLDPQWGGQGTQSLLLQELLDAAKRGVRVRVLLNDETVFDHPGHPSKPKNRTTVDLINQAAAQGLSIQGRIANLRGMGVDYIHNKGALVDGDETLISSINWDENAVEHNREAAVLITSPEIFNHYEAIFEHDWEVSAQAGSSQASSSAADAPLNPEILTSTADLFSKALEQNVEESVAHCPDAVDVNVSIGKITPSESEDSSFKELTGQSFKLSMTRDRSNRGCIFASTGKTLNKQVLEIRQDAHKNLVFSVEGYTSAGKLYSIRAKTDSPLDFDKESYDKLPSSVYDGSGPTHERLGDAKISVSLP